MIRWLFITAGSIFSTCQVAAVRRAGITERETAWREQGYNLCRLAGAVATATVNRTTPGRHRSFRVHPDGCYCDLGDQHLTADHLG